MCPLLFSAHFFHSSEYNHNFGGRTAGKTVGRKFQSWVLDKNLSGYLFIEHNPSLKRATENVDVGRGLTACRLLTGAQVWNNYYWLVERYWREYVNYLRKLRIHAQKTKSHSKDKITLKRRNHAQKTKSRFTLKNCNDVSRDLKMIGDSCSNVGRLRKSCSLLNTVNHADFWSSLKRKLCVFVLSNLLRARTDGFLMIRKT
jgi:hypothetical protein